MVSGHYSKPFKFKLSKHIKAQVRTKSTVLPGVLNWQRSQLEGAPLGKLPLQKFRVGDTVRVSRYKSIFGKGYEANFTEEIFKVRRVLRGDPTVYEPEDHEGEPIIGKFYEEELSAVNKKDNMYRVEMVWHW